MRYLGELFARNLGAGLGYGPRSAAGVTGVTDLFNRADNAASLGAADTGQAWEVIGGGTWGIIGNRAYCPTGVGGWANGVVVDSELADGTIEVTVYTDPPGLDYSGIMFRALDSGNFWHYHGRSTGTTELIRVIAGAETAYSGPNIGWDGGQTHVLEVLLAGTSIRCFCDGVEQIARTDAHNQAVTKHGIGRNGALGATQWDEFAVTG